MWKELGFYENPFSTKPLRPIHEDEYLLIGRKEEEIEFATTVESEDEGIYILSGVPGVGKTSFVNVAQFRIENGSTFVDKKLLAARQLTPIQPQDTPRQVALRCVQSLTKSIEIYCDINEISIPKSTTQISKWLSQTSSDFSIGITILGFGGNIGRSKNLPSINDISFEGLVEILETLSYEVNTELGFQGSFIVLDNLENLDDDKLSELLISFRDTLFSTDYLWWILIGQSGLASLIQSLDPRVFQRITSSTELKPVLSTELKTAVDVRVKKFHEESDKGESPISEKMYQKLYKSSNGEIRFVFKYCQQICISFIQDLRKLVIASEEHEYEDDPDAWDKAIGRYLVNNQIKDAKSSSILREIVEKEFNGYNLQPKEKKVLSLIGEKGETRAKEHKDFSIKTMQDFSSNYLNKMHKQHLLLRKQEGRAVLYRLRGISLLAKEFGLLELK